MSPLFDSADRVISPVELQARSEALGRAVDEGGDYLNLDHAARAAAISAKVEERLDLTGNHTIVALAGATGSGKSSLFNAIVGADVATVGVRRPTTSTTTAAVFGDDPATPLLDWLSVGKRYHVGADALDGAARPAKEYDEKLRGLVLLDLPDFDSRESSHREEAERVLELVDVFVWVTDPQKYADARLHDSYVKPLSTHGAVTMVVLNQSDRLSEQGVQTCLADLTALVRKDGLAKAEVMATSVTTGQGVSEFVEKVISRVRDSDSYRRRLAADITQSAEELSSSVGKGEVESTQLGHGDLVEAMGRACGVPVVIEAVRKDFILESVSRTGWPYSRWIHAFRPAPLKRFRIKEGVGINQADVRTVMGRSSLPAPSPAAIASLEVAARRVGDRASAGLPSPWANAVHEAAQPATADLADALDQAVLSTSLRGTRPMWWPVLGFVQVVLALTALLGAVWLGLRLLFATMALPEVPTPHIGSTAISWPFAMLIGGVLLGWLCAWVGRILGRRGAERRAKVVRRRLDESIGAVAEERVLEPVAQVLDQHRRTRISLDRALG